MVVVEGQRFQESLKKCENSMNKYEKGMEKVPRVLLGLPPSPRRVMSHALQARRCALDRAAAEPDGAPRPFWDPKKGPQ